MKASSFEIFWTADAQKDLNDVLDYYQTQSTKSYHLDKEAIITTLQKASLNPFIFETDNFKNVRDENFRAFTVFHTRVTYQLKNDNLYVLRLRHTSREPFKY